MADNVPGRSARSTTARLFRFTLLRRIFFYFWEDVLLACLLFCGALFQWELLETGSFSLTGRLRTLMVAEGSSHFTERLIYLVRSAQGEVLMREYAGPVLAPVARSIFTLLSILLVFQIFRIVTTWSAEHKKIRRILRPLNELARQADALNRMSFGEDKYRMMEDAIERVRTDETARLDFGDEDLRGVEAAMNNLLTRMREANMQQARFVNDASHELRTPIAVIGGYADMLERWGKEDRKVLDESVTAIKQESAHMNRLVEQLLFLARGDAGKTPFAPEDVELNGFLKEIHEESLMIDEAHSYRFVPFPEPLTAQADRGLLKQAVRILIDNAAKYTAAGDEIVLSVLRTQEENGETHPCLQVQDSGLGMQEAELPHIFERFYRSEEVRQTKGTGLGLSIAKWIVDRHGAHFEVLTRTGLGTRIRIVLP